jgi:protein-S-isoprenylcysteine O-methyltransferase Ste14
MRGLHSEPPPPDRSHQRKSLHKLFGTGGVALALSGRGTFVRFGTNVNLYKPSSALMTTGIFARLRNPMYVGLAFLVAGIGIALASDWTLVMLLPAALLIHFGVVKREEPYLVAKFADAYRAQKQQLRYASLGSHRPPLPL